MPKLVSDAGRVVMLSLSFWMQAAGILVLVIPELWFRFTGQDYDPFLVWWLSMLFLVAGLAGRLYKQGLTPWKEWGRIGVVAAICVALAFLFAWPASAAPATEAETLD